MAGVGKALALRCEASLATHLSKPCWHPHGAHSCGRTIRDVCIATPWLHPPCTAHHPARYGPCLSQSSSQLGLTWPHHSRAAGTPPWHLSGPSCHHTLCPRYHCKRSLLGPHTCGYHSTVSRPDLGKEKQVLLSCDIVLIC